MSTYYVADDVHNFRHECRPVDAYDASAAAEQYCARLFESADVDPERPIECIVAEDEHGADALKFKVRRTITITDDAHEIGPVEIPDDEDDADA